MVMPALTGMYCHSSDLLLINLSNSHAIEVKVDKVADVGEIFDDVSYAKGASLLRWLMDWLGEETMKKGYNKYLADNKYGTACSSDLWNAMESVSGKPVAKVRLTEPLVD